MVGAMRHRGPDAEGFWEEFPLAFAHRRLSIIDLSEGANQPMQDPSGRYVLLFNGELYNYRDLRAELEGAYPFSTQSDTEVLLAALIRWGKAVLPRLNGIFAFALWDRQRQRLLLARDHLGIKPLYYVQEQGRLLFASEIRALIASGLVVPCLDRASLGEYLQYYSVHSPFTLLEGVRMLEAGHWMEISPGGESKKPFWSILPGGIREGISYEEARQGVFERLARAVDRQMISDVALGAFLSGGVDSSAIVAMMAEVSSRPVHTFSVIFQEKAYDESPFSAQIARKFGTEHHPLLLSPQDFLDQMPDALAAMDHPSGDAVNTYVVSRATRAAGFTVALSGLGGDELFGGYPVFRQYQRLRGFGALYALPLPLRQVAAAALRLLPQDHRSERLRALLTAPSAAFEHLYPLFRQIYSPAEIAQLGGNWPLRAPFEGLLDLSELQRMERLPLFSQVSAGEIAAYTQSVLLRDTDQMSMASSLEVRVPFFDFELVEYVLSLPDEHKQGQPLKRLLIESLGERLPAEIYQRPKQGFDFPWEHWMRHELRPVCEQRLRSLAERGLFDGAALLRRWQQFLSGDRRVSYMNIWLLTVLEHWLERHRVNL
jgi:asparagine synthase (glutamine-hydrolysing)